MPGRPKAKAGAPKADSGIQEDGRWLPAFPGQRRPLETTHGAHSENRIRPIARSHRRRVLRQLQLSPRDLDAIGRGHLDLYVRLVSKVDLIDRYIAEHGLLRSDGEPQPALRLYVSLANSARLALVRLEAHMDNTRRKSPLDDYLDANYSEEEPA